MARKKEPPKPIAGLRFDFVNSLENLCDETMLTVQALSSVLKIDSEIHPAIKEILQERHDALRAALIGSDD